MAGKPVESLKPYAPWKMAPIAVPLGPNKGNAYIFMTFGDRVTSCLKGQLFLTHKNKAFGRIVSEEDRNSYKYQKRWSNIMSLKKTTTSKKLPRPRIQNPRLFKDSIAWLRIFERRSQVIEAPFYGVNIWRVKKKNLLRSICYMIKIAGPGLTEMFGQIRFIEFYQDDDTDTFIVVLIYQWNSLPVGKDVMPPLSIIPMHFSFIGMVEAYNWNLVNELEVDPSVYALKLNDQFHEDLCEDR